MLMARGKHLIVPDEVLINKIFILRNQRIMLDRDLAELYGVKSIRLREQVQRNIARFPAKFMFQLTNEEVEFMVSQNAIPSKRHLGGAQPFAFTEHGILMLANVLKSEKAIAMSVRIIEVFIRMRELMLTNKEVLLQLEILEKHVIGNSEDIRKIFSALRHLLNPPKPPRKKIGFQIGQEPGD